MCAKKKNKNNQGKEMNNNKIVVDLNKVQWMSLYYKNQWEDYSQRKPKKITTRGRPINPEEKALMKDMSLISAIEYAKQLGIIDTWTPYCKLQLSANHSLVYSGEKAISIWKEWNKRIFNKHKL
jgi:hypothetical protein